MNKRTTERFDFSSEFVPVTVSSYGNKKMTCILKDISTLGIGFYSFNDSISPEFGKYVTVSFTINGKEYQFELEMLRESKKHFGYMNAARITGVNSPNTRKFEELLASLESNFYAIS